MKIKIDVLKLLQLVTCFGLLEGKTSKLEQGASITLSKLSECSFNLGDPPLYVA